MSTKLWLLALLGLAPLACGPSATPGEAAPQTKSATQTAAAEKSSSRGSAIYLHRWVEPKEGALTILLPEGWGAEGGVIRIDPKLGPANSAGVKIDITVKKDRSGSVMIHWFPNFTYKDPRFLTGSFLIGSNYMGSMVYPLLDPHSFLSRCAFLRYHPQAQNVQITERKPLSEMAQRYRQRAAAPNIQYEAGSLTVIYDENGVLCRKEMAAVIENIAGPGFGMWTNRNTMAVRAPAAEFAQSEPLIALIVASLKGSPQWVASENRGAATRARNALENQRYLQEQQRQIVEHRRETNAELRHSCWLFLTGQDVYVNPHTGEVEQGSNQYKQRWVNSAGDVIYSNDAEYDPSWDTKLPGRSDYKRSPLRPR